jgi:hypothetical protein
MTTVADLKAGEFFKLTMGSTAVYVRGHYDRGSKRYSVTRFDDVNAERFLKGTTAVTVDFEF